ncbi:MAG TPA: hypothetical protein VM889_07125 [Candidatus Thermoplasmatota archaeon]|nr:hypothetical protein [Candidatus Thermoplasmatota archaeon]
MAVFAPFALAAGIGEMRVEAFETNRAELDAQGQLNCVVEAFQGPTPSPACPLELRRSSPGVLTPDAEVTGIRILDAFFASDGLPDSPPATLHADGSNVGYSVSSMQRFSTERGTGGAVPAVIHPGRGWWTAWYGVWEDKNRDGVLDVRIHVYPGATGNRQSAAPDNEMLGIPHVPIAAFVEPGNHPTQDAAVMPSEDEADFTYNTNTPGATGSDAIERRGFVSTNTYAFFYDGSILRTFVVTTVANGTFVPQMDGLPYFCDIGRCLADIDRYPAVAPAPVASLYGAIAAPFVDALPPPAVNLLCPNNCWVPPLPLSPEGQRAAGPALGALFAEYPQETSTDASGPHASSASGRLSAFQDGYRGWLDLIPSYFIPAGSQTHKPMVGVSPGSDQAHMPGWLNIEIFTGAWKDLNRDGYIGTASTPDPHEYGNRPLADDYGRSRGEFRPHYAINENGALKGLLCVFFTPDRDWGPAGVVIGTTVGVPSVGTRYSARTNPCDPSLQNREQVDRDTSVWHVTGNRPFGLYVDPNPAMEGHYWSSFSRTVFFPQGTAGIPFRMCTERASIDYVDDGAPARDEVWDCDHVASLV